MFKVGNKNTKTMSMVLLLLTLNTSYFTFFSSASIVDVEQVDVTWVITINFPNMHFVKCFVSQSLRLSCLSKVFDNKSFKYEIHKNYMITSTNKWELKEVQRKIPHLL